MSFGPRVMLAAAAALMVGASVAMPPIGQRYTPTFQRAVEYDGLGRKVKPPSHPRHNANRRDVTSWRRFCEAVTATHRYKPDGSWNVDPRADKHLHSHARAMRGLRAAIAA